MSQWDPEAAKAALEMERSVMGVDINDPAEVKKAVLRIFSEHGMNAALAITHMALHSDNDRIRLDAAKYVVERTVGKIGEDNEGGEDPIEVLVRQIMSSA